VKKYKLFRSPGNLNRDIKKHVLVAVEYGETIYDVTDALIKAANEDATGVPQYQKWYTAESYAPKPVESFRRVKRYAYEMDAILMPDRGEKNDILEYGVTEEETDEA
jgi:hypothetical protein